MQDNQPMQTKGSSLAIPLAIIIAGAIVGAGIFFSGTPTGTEKLVLPSNNINQPLDIDFKAPSKDDHILGTLNTPVVLVEYSDTECPFCKTFHTNLQTLLAEYGPKNEVSWVFRHFPIAQLHSKAPKEAQATECAADQGKFWPYLDRLMEITPSQNNLDLAQLPEIAKTVGLDVDTFNSCLASTKHVAEINQSITEAQSAGANGTPSSFLVLSKPLSEKDVNDIILATAPLKLPDGTPLVTIDKDRNIVSMSGAIPLDFIRGTLEIILR